MDFTGKTVDFNGGPVLAPSPTNKRERILKEEYVITVGTNLMLVCPAGMHTDGQSAPWWAWLIVGTPWELPNSKAAVAHDGCYRGFLQWFVRNHKREWVEEEYTREDSDLLHLALIRWLKIHWFKRTVMFVALRWRGGSSWTER